MNFLFPETIFIWATHVGYFLTLFLLSDFEIDHRGSVYVYTVVRSVMKSIELLGLFPLIMYLQ